MAQNLLGLDVGNIEIDDKIRFDTNACALAEYKFGAGRGSFGGFASVGCRMQDCAGGTGRGHRRLRIAFYRRQPSGK